MFFFHLFEFWPFWALLIAGTILEVGRRIFVADLRAQIAHELSHHMGAGSVDQVEAILAAKGYRMRKDQRTAAEQWLASRRGI